MAAAGPYRLAGVMGWPVAHSRSPLLHQHWIAEHGLAGAYVLLPVPPERLAQALRALPALGFAGCNLTIPHKVEALRMVDRVDPVALRVGAINTVVVEADGSLSGRNTDVYGFVQSLRDTRADWRGDAGPAVVLGAGGAARAVVAGLLEAGVRELRLVNRTPAAAQRMAADFGPAVQAISWEGRHAALGGSALLVNTTNQGMQGQGALDLALDDLPRDALVCDVVYTPLLTPLLAAARSRGNPVVDGLGMLMNQACAAFEAWWGVRPVVGAALRARLEASL
jgi:shikimate dehydrogenase